MNLKLVSLAEVAEAFDVPEAVIMNYAETGLLTTIQVGPRLWTTKKWVKALMNTLTKAPPTLKAGEGSNAACRPDDLPTLEQLATIKWEKISPVSYTTRLGQQVYWEDATYVHHFEINGKLFPLTIIIYDNPPPGEHERFGAEVCRGEIGHGPQRIVEWAKTNDYASSHMLASVIKENGKAVSPNQEVPSGYEGLEIRIFSDVVTRPYSWNSRCVLAHDNDFAVMARHALLRCRQKGWI